MSINEVTQPNQRSNELEQHRKKSLDDFVKEKKFGKKPEEEEKPEKSEKKLDKEEKNSYINNDEEVSDEKEKQKSSEEEEKSEKESSDDEQYEKILNETFGGDPKKAVKSWKESQKSFGKLRKEKKEKEQQLQYLNQLVEKNPMLGDIIKTAAEKGEISKQDLQNFLSEGTQEPNGKPNQSSSESKLKVVDDEGFDVSDIDTRTLAESGYIDPDRKDSMSPSEWRILKRQAAVKYAEDKLPQRLANKAYQQFQSQIDEAQKQKKQKERQQKNRQKNAERYEKGLERVIDEFNLDFAGNEEHEQMLDDIESVAVNIRDPQNSDVIHPNAIYLATMQVMEDKGIQLQKSRDVDKEVEKAKQKADESFDKRTGFNANTKKKEDKKPETLADKMSNRHFQDYQKEQEKRKRTGRIPGSDA